ncbi:Tn3 family transposase [Streptomyces anulatus]|uniref:Tn3 family transposase n=1 Tax=Streptomyces anulatus TaxID=1892 RepID=UPI00331F7DC4
MPDARHPDVRHLDDRTARRPPWSGYRRGEPKPGGIACHHVSDTSGRSPAGARARTLAGTDPADNDPVEQEKAMKFNALLTNAVIFHHALDIAEIVRHLPEGGWTIEPEDLAHISPYLTEHINRFGEYSTHELGIQPDAYDPKLDVDFTPLREQDLTAAGLGQAA